MNTDGLDSNKLQDVLNGVCMGCPVINVHISDELNAIRAQHMIISS